MKLLKGDFSIGRVSGNNMPMRIELTDKDSGCIVVLVRMTALDFAECLNGLSNVDCEFEFNDSGLIGMQAQNKTEMVPIPSSRPYKDDSWISPALAPFEVDGWKARKSDITNHHLWSRDKSGQEFQRVVFFRHVPKETA